jgi:nicotinate phosphoribosyltransferase
MIERSAFIGGCDGVSTLVGAKILGIEPSGTVPHALILIMGNTVEAMKAFHEIIDRKVKRVALIDTLEDEKFEALRVAEALGKDLFAIRFDTPSSRRGNFVELIKEVRWELELRGFEHVKVFVSGGIDENKIRQLNEVVDGYGIGTSISNSPTIDFSMDIVEVEGKPFAKRGKESGKKSLFRCKKCFTTYIKSSKNNKFRCHCGGRVINLMELFIEEGNLKNRLPDAKEIRKYVFEQLSCMKGGTK